jgi:MYXO-CTERM domain-containing protein
LLGFAPQVSDQEADQQALAAIPKVFWKNACDPGTPGTMRCHAKVVTDENGDVVYHAGPTAGLLPADLRAAYKLPASGGNGRLVAIVDGFDAPTAEADMNMYRAQFGIPPCTTANGCFRKVNTDGQPSPLPPGDAGWATEIAVDLDMVSAMCPDCKILLVEAKTGYAVDLGPAVQRAGMMGAVAINNSYGEPEDNAMMARLVENDYNLPGVLVVASSGDDGYGKSTEDDGTVVTQNSNPANLPWVLSVGGTTLTKSTSARGWAETTWRGAGSGCSSHMPKPAWQKDPNCPRRMISDVSAVADPATGVAYVNGGRWSVVGGTSISSPIVTGIFALFGINANSWPYDHPSSFFDIVGGNNGSCPTPYFCQGLAGYDGPTGLGTPNGALFNATPPADAGPKPDSGGAGAGGSTGSGGAGGSTTSGGGNGTAGSAPTGAGGSSGGSDPTTGSGGAATTTSGTTGTAGTTGSTTDGTSTTATTSGAGGSDVTSSGTGPNPFAPKATEDSGCSCRVGASSSSASRFAWLLLGIALVGARRRTRAPRS